MPINALINWIELGMIFAVMALGVYISFRILDFPDLTVDGSFVTGGAITAVMLVFGYPSIIATLVAPVLGFIVGCMTGILHTKGKINALLSGILMMIALYSINLRIMGFTNPNGVSTPNISLLRMDTIYTPIENLAASTVFSQWGIIIFLAFIIIVLKLLTDYFLKTEFGLALRATGNNKRMIRNFSGNTDFYLIIGIGISNAFVALSGALFAQYSQFADNTMGVGMIVIGLASIIIGEALLGTKSIFRSTFAVLIGAILYRVIIGVALMYGILEASDQKLITALIVVAALILPKMISNYREKVRKRNRAKEKSSLESKANGVKTSA